jgi:hypothetical protein
MEEEIPGISCLHIHGNVKTATLVEHVMTREMSSRSFPLVGK